MSDNMKTIGYAALMTLIVAISLSLLTSVLRPIQKTNEDLDKKKAILKAVELLPGADVEKEYSDRIEAIVVDSIGNLKADGNAFDIEIRKEDKKQLVDRSFPIFIYTSDTKKKSYIIPMRGMGLWDAIWGYIALEEDLNTIKGVSFDHAGETPGLGAEITQAWFQDQFQGKKLMDAGSNFQFDVLKGRGNSLSEYSIDGITGATITADGVETMMKEDLGAYSGYFSKTLKASRGSGGGVRTTIDAAISGIASRFFNNNKSEQLNLNFIGNTSIIDPTSENQVKALGAYLSSNPEKRIEVQVSDKDKLELAERRGEQIVTEALQHGAAKNQLTYSAVNANSSSVMINLQN